MTTLRLVFERCPRLVVNSVATGVMYSTGDFMAQRLEKASASSGSSGSKNKYTLYMGVFGLLCAGPLMSVWYRQIHVLTRAFRFDYVPMKSTATSAWVSTVLRGNFQRIPREGALRIQEIAVKVIFDNLFFQAAFLNLYLFTTSLMQGSSRQEAYDRCKRDFHDAWGWSMLFWVPAQAVNFSLVPVRYNAIFVSSANVVWQTFLAWMYNGKDSGGAPAPAALGACGGATPELVSLADGSVVQADPLDSLRRRNLEQEAIIDELQQRIRSLELTVEHQGRMPCDQKPLPWVE